MQTDDTTITAALELDHRRLDALLEEASDALEAGDPAAAGRAFAEFSDGLARHIRFEEVTLFPVFEERTGMRNGPTTVMRHEHRLILGALADMAQALERAQPDRFADGAATLTSVLEAHNMKEERILYPTTDEVVDAAERRALLERLPTA